MFSPRKKLDLVQGKKYKGYGILNEYGEFEFIPEQTGAHKGRKKLVKEGEGYSVYTTNSVVSVRITFPKDGGMFELVKSFINLTNEVLNILRTYEI